MRNMRIEFGDDRDEVIKELERLGYFEAEYNGGPYNPEDAECNIIVAYESGNWIEYCHDAYTTGDFHHAHSPTSGKANSILHDHNPKSKGK